jgi:hypothetical protein
MRAGGGVGAEEYSKEFVSVLSNDARCDALEWCRFRARERQRPLDWSLPLNITRPPPCSRPCVTTVDRYFITRGRAGYCTCVLPQTPSSRTPLFMSVCVHGHQSREPSGVSARKRNTNCISTYFHVPPPRPPAPPPLYTYPGAPERTHASTMIPTRLGYLHHYTTFRFSQAPPVVRCWALSGGCCAHTHG